MRWRGGRGVERLAGGAGHSMFDEEEEVEGEGGQGREGEECGGKAEESVPGAN